MAKPFSQKGGDRVGRALVDDQQLVMMMLHDGQDGPCLDRAGRYGDHVRHVAQLLAAEADLAGLVHQPALGVEVVADGLADRAARQDARDLRFGQRARRAKRTETSSGGSSADCFPNKLPGNLYLLNEDCGEDSPSEDTAL